MPNLRQLVGRLPILGPVARAIHRRLAGRGGENDLPDGSEGYWKHRYEAGGDSGAGSRGKLAEFKARIVNAFVRENGIASVIELGCGDGHQLGLADYPSYLGYDVSPVAVERCRERFHDDRTKRFSLMSEYAGERADLCLSLDVIYHLVEDHVFDEYMYRLFDAADRFVVIYSSNTDLPQEDQCAHVRHRTFTRWVEDHAPGWVLARHVPNEHPYRGNLREGTIADFFVYRRSARGGGPSRIDAR